MKKDELATALSTLDATAALTAFGALIKLIPQIFKPTPLIFFSFT
ncbi:MAG: hypothetical protein QW161_06705 [Candidatus Bathyarchaeia archaeon]